jgi:DNA-binding IclR family transcriptional regulator
MNNIDHRRSETAARILDYLRTEQRSSLTGIARAFGFKPQRVLMQLYNLRAAGKVRRISLGMYEFIND